MLVKLHGYLRRSDRFRLMEKLRYTTYCTPLALRSKVDSVVGNKQVSSRHDLHVTLALQAVTIPALQGVYL